MIYLSIIDTVASAWCLFLCNCACARLYVVIIWYFSVISAAFFALVASRMIPYVAIFTAYTRLFRLLSVFWHSPPIPLVDVSASKAKFVHILYMKLECTTASLPQTLQWLFFLLDLTFVAVQNLPIPIICFFIRDGQVSRLPTNLCGTCQPYEISHHHADLGCFLTLLI